MTGHRVLDAGSLPAALAQVPEACAQLGGKAAAWQVSEIGDGNMNLVFRVAGPAGRLIAKQSLPWIRSVGESWPFPLSRIAYEHRALLEQARHAPERVPRVIAFLPAQHLLLMELLEPHRVLRAALVEGQSFPLLAEQLGGFLARTLFATSTLALPAERAMALAAGFAGNGHLVDTTAEVVFTGPLWPAPLNRHTTPALDATAKALRADAVLKLAAAELRHRFLTVGEALIHGDLHSGSVMVTPSDCRVIDPEWAFYGPMGFDLGALLGNLLLAHAALPGQQPHATESRVRQQEWLLESVAAIWQCFADDFLALWRAHPGPLLPGEAFAPELAERFRQRRLTAILQDAMGFAGAKMLRRILGISHVADFESIADPERRAACERRALAIARTLLVERSRFEEIGQMTALARLGPG